MPIVTETGTLVKNNDTWPIGTGNGARWVEYTIKFNTRFVDLPQVLVALCYFNTDCNRHAILYAEPIGIMKTQFTLKFSTTSDSLIYGAGVNWLAIGGSK